MDLAIPYVFIFYVAQFASRVDITDKYIEADFTLEHLGLLKKSQLKLLKQIEGDFGPSTNAKGEEAFWQMYVDDNAFNSFASMVTTIEKMFSVRTIFKGYPQVMSAIKMLTTSNIGQVFPDIVEEYGSGKNVDIIFSPSHALFVDGVPDAKPSGVYMDKNGNVKFQANVPLQMNVEQSGGRWEPIRNIFVSFLFQGKISTQDGPNGQTFNLQVKTIKISQILIKNHEGEEMDLEQMLIQSMVNLQLENVKKEFKSRWVDPNAAISRQPKQIACFGINLSNIELLFGKSQAKFSWFWKEAEQPEDHEVCASFFRNIMSHQEEVVKQMNNDKSDLNQTFKSLAKAHGAAIDSLEQKEKPKKASFVTDDL